MSLKILNTIAIGIYVSIMAIWAFIITSILDIAGVSDDTLLIIFGIIAMLALLVWYLVFIITSHIDYTGWIKASSIVNIVGVVLILPIFLLGKFAWMNCSMSIGDMCDLILLISAILTIPATALFSIIGFILLLIGIKKRKRAAD